MRFFKEEFVETKLDFFAFDEIFFKTYNSREMCMIFVMLKKQF